MRLGGVWNAKLKDPFMYVLTYRRSNSPAPVQKPAVRNQSRMEQNARVQHILGQRRAQAKLKIGAPNDKYEQEADRVARAVVDNALPKRFTQLTSDTSLQRQVCMIQGEDVPLEAASVPVEDATPLEEEATQIGETEQIQRACEECEREAVQKSPAIQTTSEGQMFGSSDIAQKIKSNKGLGNPLPTATRNELRSKMGADFSDVRVHTDNAAIQMSKELGAHAFTHGSDIFFNSGKYNPESQEGKHLLVHELTHTIQQNDDIVQRLSITAQTPLVKGACGAKFVRWIFALGSAAPSDGYIVQQLDAYEEIKDCPQTARCLANPTNTFWEAWFVNKGDTHEHLHGTLGYTDQHSRPGRPKKSGYDASAGEVKFFPRSVTGDLGKDGVAPASPNGGWGPGNAPLSGALPSTKTRPAWWNNTPTEGPKTRIAYSAWRCCGGASDYNVVRADP